MLISIAFIYCILSIQTIYAQEETIEVYIGGCVKDELGDIVRDIEVAIRIESSVEKVVAFSKDGYYHCILHIREDDLYRPLPVMVDYDNIRLLETITIIPDQKFVVLDITIKRYLIEETVTETFSPTTTITFTVPTITLYWVGLKHTLQ